MTRRLIFVLLLLAAPAQAANRYWVGGGSSANWNATGNTNWGTASNTQDNASVPGSSDAVIFDGVGTGNSASTLSANITVASVDFTGYANTFTHAAGVNFTVLGDANFSTGMTYTIASFNCFLYLTGNGTLTTHGKPMPNVRVNSSTGGNLQLGDDVTTIYAFEVNPDTVPATFTTNSHNIAAGQFNSGNGSPTLALGTSTISVSTGAGDASVQITLTTPTFTGSGIFKLTHNGSDGTKVAINKSPYELWDATTGTSAMTIDSSGGTATFNTLKINNGRTVKVVGTVSVTNLLDASGSGGTCTTPGAANCVTLEAVTDTTPWNLTLATDPCLDYLYLRDSVASMAAHAGAHSTDGTGNTNWTFTTCAVDTPTPSPTSTPTPTNTPTSTATPTLVCVPTCPASDPICVPG